VSLRRELVALSGSEGANVSELCRRMGVSRNTFYKWRRRAAGQASGDAAPVAESAADSAAAAAVPAVAADPMSDRSRRPLSSPGRTPADVEAAVLAVRGKHPAWGGRKIRAVLVRRGELDAVPAASTITEILRRHDRLSDARLTPGPFKRFERATPNELWQADFKGDFALANGARCHPLTMTDDHSRYNLLLLACANQRRETVEAGFTQAFARYGLPKVLLTDNGSPWGVSHDAGCYTRLEVWLMRLDVRLIHGRAYHPETQGKEERFHKTLKVELLQGRTFDDPAHAQAELHRWREVYNHERPHEALGLATPASRYAPAARPYPPGGADALPPWEYPATDPLRVAGATGQLQFHRVTYKLSEAFAGQQLALRPTAVDGVLDVYFRRFRVAIIDQRDASATMKRP
jgi:transposase InsO family protein